MHTNWLIFAPAASLAAGCALAARLFPLPTSRLLFAPKHRAGDATLALKRSLAQSSQCAIRLHSSSWPANLSPRQAVAAFARRLSSPAGQTAAQLCFFLLFDCLARRRRLISEAESADAHSWPPVARRLHMVAGRPLGERRRQAGQLSLAPLDESKTTGFDSVPYSAAMKALGQPAEPLCFALQPRSCACVCV